MKITAARAAKNKEVARLLLGDVREPATFDSMVHGLRFYSAHSDPKHSKAWAISWVEAQDSELAKKLHSVKETSFSNRGYICRIIELGVPVEESVVSSLLPFFKGIVHEKSDIIEDVPIPNTKPAKKKLTREHSANLAMLSLDEQIDNAIRGDLIKKVEVGSNKDELLQVERYIQNLLDEFVKCKEGYTPRVIAILRPLLKTTLHEVQSILATLTKTKVRTAVLEKTPAQMIKNVKYQLEDTSLNLKSILLKEVLGKRQCWAYDTETRFLMKFVALAEGGFWFSGTTLHNIDFDKSVRRIVRKPEEFFSKIARPLTFDGINTAYETIRAKDLQVRSGQTNEHLIFLRV